MTMGRPKAEIPRSERISLRLTKFESDEISRIAENLKISKTDAILRGIELLKNSLQISKKIQNPAQSAKKFEKPVKQPKISKKSPKKKFPKLDNISDGNDDDGEIVFFKDMKYEDIPKNLRKNYEYKKYE